MLDSYRNQLTINLAGRGREGAAHTIPPIAGGVRTYKAKTTLHLFPSSSCSQTVDITYTDKKENQISS